MKLKFSSNVVNFKFENNIFAIIFRNDRTVSVVLMTDRRLYD